MKKKKLILAVVAPCFIIAHCGVSQTVEPFHFFPDHQLLKPFVGDGMSHRFGVAKFFGNRQFRGSVGAVIPVLNTDYPGVATQLSLAASVHAQLDLSQSISLISTEFVVDFFLLDIQWDAQTILRFGMSHTSHHLGDNDLTRLEKPNPLDYSRDYMQLLLVREFSPLRVYAGAHYAYDFVVNTPVKKPWWIQTGADGEVLSFGPGFTLYAACDIKLRQEMNYASTQRLEVGLLWPSDNGRNLRISVAHQRGEDERGQFFAEHVRWNSIGLAIGI